ncbi:MAG TPA: hypothetical protein VN452_02940 [Longilinea sp.]|nr:hypothetical protein [Longilinea sp.]
MNNDFPAELYPIRKVFICQNGDCSEKERSRELYARLLDLRTFYQLDDPAMPQHFKCNLTGCLNVCKGGPILVIQPDQILYRCPTDGDLLRIFQSHLLNNQPVVELITWQKDA